MIAQLDPLYIKARPGKAIVRLMSHFLFQGRFLTTGYRWLNPLILTELKMAKRLPRLKVVDRPIFIVGTGRSGSTILGKVLSMHREIAFLNEPKALWYVVEPREDVNGHFSSSAAQYRLNEEDVTREKRCAAHRLFSFYLSVTGSSRVLDKNPEILFRIPYVQAIFPDAKFIFLVRNGWDTIHSITAWSRQNGKSVNGEVQDWWGLNQRKWRFMVEQLVGTEPLLAHAQAEVKALTRQEDMAAVEWVVTMQEGLRLMRPSGDSIFLVRYEDLTERPEQTLRNLTQFCELAEDEVFLSYAKQVLSPNQAKEPCALAPVIEPAFLKTLKMLGYPAGQELVDGA